MQHQVQNDELIDETALSRRLLTKPATLSRWRYAGKGPRFVKVGRLVRYRLSDVLAWISQQERSSTSDTGDEPTMLRGPQRTKNMYGDGLTWRRAR